MIFHQVVFISGFGASIARIIEASQVHAASAVYGNGAGLDAIAAVVVGVRAWRAATDRFPVLHWGLC